MRNFTSTVMRMDGRSDSSLPRAIFSLASQFDRILCGCDDITYSPILTNVRVGLQTMYLVATAMGLVPCVVGAWSSGLIAVAAGINGLAEGSVGDFVLTQRPLPENPSCLSW